MNLTRRLRNDFAHNSGPIDLNDQRSRDRLFKFIGKDDNSAVRKTTRDLVKALGDEAKEQDSFYRAAFIVKAMMLAGTLATIEDTVVAGVDMQSVAELVDNRLVRVATVSETSP